MPFILYGGNLWLSGTTDEAIMDDRSQDMNGNQEQIFLFFDSPKLLQEFQRNLTGNKYSRCSLTSLFILAESSHPLPIEFDALKFIVK